MTNKKIDELIPSKILKDKNTDVKFNAWLKKEFTTLNKLRLVRAKFLLTNHHKEALVIFIKMKAMAKSSKKVDIIEASG